MAFLKNLDQTLKNLLPQKVAFGLILDKICISKVAKPLDTLDTRRSRGLEMYRFDSGWGAPDGGKKISTTCPPGPFPAQLVLLEPSHGSGPSPVRVHATPRSTLS